MAMAAAVDERDQVAVAGFLHQGLVATDLLARADAQVAAVLDGAAQLRQRGMGCAQAASVGARRLQAPVALGQGRAFAFAVYALDRPNPGAGARG